MKKIQKAGELLWLFGIILVALGVSICSKADLGVSMIAAPAFVVSEKLLGLSSFFSVGVTEYLLQGVLLILMCMLIRRFKFRYLLGFAVAVLYGYTLNFFVWTMSFIPISTVLARWIALIIGDIITAAGVACFFRTHMPLQVYELFVAECAKAFKVNISKAKMIFDYTLLFVSILLACTLFGDIKELTLSTFLTSSYHSIGLGTIVTTAINSPLIALAGKLIDKTFDPAPRFVGKKS